MNSFGKQYSSVLLGDAIITCFKLNHSEMFKLQCAASAMLFQALSLASRAIKLVPHSCQLWTKVRDMTLLAYLLV